MEYQAADENGNPIGNGSPNGATGTRNGKGKSLSASSKNTDLLFTVEEGTNGTGGNGRHPGGVPPVADPTDEYFGLEQELEFRLARRRRNRFIALTALFIAFVAGIMVHRAGKAVEDGVEEVEEDLRGKQHHHTGSSTGGKNTSPSSGAAPAPAPSPASSPTSPTMSSVVQDVDEAIEEIEDISTASLWPTATPPSSFDVCAPRLWPDIKAERKAHLPVFHIGEFDTVPESATKNANDDISLEYNEEWEFALSAMDLSDDASIIAVGFGDYSGPPLTSSGDINYSYSAVGMVRTFAFDCHQRKYRQFGQDLRGSNEGEQFGHHVSTSSDGKTMAVSAPSESYDGGSGFVNVYYLDESLSQPKWARLGSRIDNLDSSVNDYDRIGHAIDLSSRGETLAILGVSDTNSYIVRVYQFDTKTKDWKLKGKELSVTVNYEDDYEFAPQLSLSDAGDELSVSDPEFGVVRYKFKWQTAKWNKMENKAVNFTYADPNSDQGEEEEWWIDGIATDRSADVIAFTAWEDNYATDEYDFQAIKLVDFSTGKPVEAYDSLWTDYAVGVNVAVALDGGVAAVVVSKYDVDDDEFWADESVIGAMTILSKGDDDAWSIVGEGTASDAMGVPGNFVSMSGDGRIVAVGSDNVVALYGVILPEGGAGDHATTEGDASDTAGGEDATEDETSTSSTSKFDICPPFADVDFDSAPGNLESLPKSPDEHTIALALSSDASLVAIGIDSYDGEDRGLARVYGWSCADAKYIQVGQDLFGGEEFDGFGQAVDLSSDGKSLVVGANQPPPGKSGYVEVYSLVEDGGDDSASFEWSLIGHRIENLPETVGDVGREVKISHDGSIVTFSGSILSTEDGFGYDHSFVRTVHNKKGEWKTMGDDLIGSVDFDVYGSETHISMSGDGKTLAVVGSYGDFMSKIYTYNSDKKNWTEVVIPSPGASYDDLDDWEYDDDGGYGYVEWDDDVYYDYFTGKDVSLNSDGKILAVAGTGYTNTEEGAMVRMLRLDDDSGNWTLSTDPIDFTDDYILSSVAIDDDGGHMVVGINSHTDGFDDQGALFVATAVSDVDGDSLLDWANSTGIVEGQAKDDLLGSRVAISADGKLAAASSRKGYISFYKTLQFN